MANNIDSNKPVAICDQSKIEVTKCDINKVVMSNIEPLIKVVRGQQVMLDKDLAMLYGVETKRLNEQVKRNIKRFPEDFMFQLTKEECLRSQFVTLNVLLLIVVCKDSAFSLLTTITKNLSLERIGGFCEKNCYFFGFWGGVLVSFEAVA